MLKCKLLDPATTFFSLKVLSSAMTGEASLWSFCKAWSQGEELGLKICCVYLAALTANSSSAKGTNVMDSALGSPVTTLSVPRQAFQL